MLEYRLLDDNGAERGRGVLSVDMEGANLRLTSAFESGANTDTTSVLTDATTLKPISSLREITRDDPDDDERVEVEYTPAGVVIRVGDGSRQSGLTADEHHYDNDSSIFLWRTLPFAEGYEGSYMTVIPNHRAQQQVVLRVTGKETVTVPAGRFEAWRLEVITSTARQVAWFADTPARPLVRYDNDIGTVFELVTPLP